MIVAILVLGLFIVAFLIGAFNSLIDLIRSSKFIDVSAEKVDHVSQYSKEWGKYYPELYEKRLKFEGFLDKAEEAEYGLGRFVLRERNNVANHDKEEGKH